MPNQEHASRVFKSSPEAEQRRVRAYHTAMEPVLQAFSMKLNMLPVRYLRGAGGRLTLDENWPVERKALLEQLDEISRTVWESLKVESFGR